MNHPESQGMTRVAGWSDSMAYEWAVVDLWYDPSDEGYYLYSDSGCSCDGPYDYYHSKAGMKPVRSWLDLSAELHVSPRDKSRFIQEYLDHKTSVALI